MPVKTTILIAEDTTVNRKVLVKLLSAEYALVEAENGQEALDLLRKYGNSISAVILDLIMPVLDGFGFLKAIQKMDAYKNLPLIVAADNMGDQSAVEALKLGAWDFITKPYNGDIIRFRLKNAIERSQFSAFNQLKFLAEYDTLTGIYNKTKFFQMTRKMLDANPGTLFAFLRLNIDQFQLINSFFGSEEGDKLLCFLADSFRAAYSSDTYTYGRMEADVFAACFAYSTKDAVLLHLEHAKERIKSYNRSFNIVPVFGVYFLDDLSLGVNEMLDRAELAAKTCKGQYLSTTAIYQPQLRQRLEEEQEIINEMSDALEQKQFCIYLQPKYALSTNRPAGGEALVRWHHPQKGMISPDEFIPIFERNGFISKLDYFVWESVCFLLHQWLQHGMSPSPISVNVSRVNLYDPNLVDIITDLIQKYAVPPHLLQLEMTENAYMGNPQMMEQMVNQLHKAGFTVLIDDFGSGYSSLSVLKNVDVDALKIDIRFFEKTRVSGRGENIIASIVRMAKWLNLSVIAEGVETQEQVDFLRSAGCDYVQGFYFARPMPVDDYVNLVRETNSAAQTAVEAGRYAGLNPDRLWSLEPEMLLLFSDDPSPKAICGFNGDELELLRVNLAFKDLLGFAADTSPLDFIAPEHHESVLAACCSCAETQEREECEYRRVTAHGKQLWIRLTLQYIQQVGTKYILMAHMENITALKLMETNYLDALSHSPTLRRFDLSRPFTLSNIRELLAFLTQIFDVARLVDPVNTSVVSLPNEGGLAYKPYTCFNVWGKGTRCENCSSICALRNDCRMTKYEYIKNNIFYVVSNPVTVEDNLGKCHKFALELVSHISDHLMITPPNGKTIEQMIEETQKKIYTDALTGAYNRRYLSELMFSHHAQKCVAKRLGLVLLDLSRFKQINDRYGHETGDSLLVATAKKLRETVRQSDSVIRYGGDEFVVILTECSEAQVIDAVERMRKALGSIPYCGEGTSLVQADFGYAYTDRFDTTYATVQELLRIADAAMYREKHFHKATTQG